MSKEFGTLAHWWNGLLEQVIGKLCSRKYNGWSAIWDGGITRGMRADDVPWYYKGGDKDMPMSTGLWSLGRDNKPKVIHAPKYFTKHLPLGIPVHGELWYNDRIDIIKRYCSRKIMYHPIWYAIQFIAFNIKPYELWEGIKILKSHYTYENNLKYIDSKRTTINITHNIDKNIVYSDTLTILGFYINDTFKVIEPELILLEGDLIKMQTKAIKEKWEGLMFANPNGLYELCRSWNNLKWKPEYDAEAAIHDYEKGKTGKNIGKVGALWASLVWDKQVISIHGGDASMVGKEAVFKIGGLTDVEREWKFCKRKYPTGSRIKFKFTSVSVHGTPQSCNIYREKNNEIF